MSLSLIIKTEKRIGFSLLKKIAAVLEAVISCI